MKLRAAAAAFYIVLGVVALADFAGVVSTMADPTRLADAANALGIGAEAQRVRLAFLLPLAGLVAFLSLSVGWGALLQEYRWPRRILVTALLVLYAAFQVVTALTAQPAAIAFAALFTASALISYWLVRSTSPTARLEPA